MMSSPAAGRLTRAVFQSIEAALGDSSSLDGLAELEADLLATVTAVGVIGKGGFHLWYTAKGAADSTRVAEGFERLGLTDVADAVRRSLKVFPEGHGLDAAACAAHVRTHRGQVAAEFDDLDSIVWEADYDSALLRHILAHRSELTAAHPELSAAFRRYDAESS